MKLKKRQKLCHNCEGGIDLDVIVCPYCAADLRIEKPIQQRELPPINPQPLYTQPHETEDSIPESSSEPQFSMLTPHLLLAFGSQLFMLGLPLLIFSHHGALILKLNARYWLFYIVASLPLLIFGYRSLSKTSKSCCKSSMIFLATAK